MPPLVVLSPTKPKASPRPLRLEIFDLKIDKSSKDWHRACRVVRMYQDQAHTMSTQQQAEYICSTVDYRFYQLNSQSEHDARFHQACRDYILGGRGLEHIPYETWLLLHALYEVDQLDDLVASAPGAGPRATVPAPRYDEYRRHYPLNASSAMLQLPPLDEMPFRDTSFQHPRPGEPSLSNDHLFGIKGVKRDGSGEMASDGTDDGAASAACKKQRLCAATNTRASTDATSQDVAAPQEAIVKALEKIGERIGGNDEVVRFFKERLQTLEQQIVSLTEEVEDLKSQVL